MTTIRTATSAELERLLRDLECDKELDDIIRSAAIAGIEGELALRRTEAIELRHGQFPASKGDYPPPPGGNT